MSYPFQTGDIPSAADFNALFSEVIVAGQAQVGLAVVAREGAETAATSAAASAAAIMGTSVLRVDAIANTSAMGLVSGVVVFAKGRTTAGDGGGGLFTYNSTSVATVDGGIIFAPIAGSGRFFRDGYTVFGFTHEVNFAWYGPDATGAVDAAQALRNACVAGRRLYIHAGVFRVESDVTPAGTLHVRGAGAGVATLRSINNPGGDRIFVGLGVSKANFSVTGVTFLGSWLANQSEFGSNGAITLTQFDRVDVVDCEFLYTRFMGLNFNNCSAVEVRGNVFRYCVRDCVAIWGTPDVLVTGNTVDGCDDDWCSISLATPVAVPVRDSVVICNNNVSDALGIKTQGVKNLGIFGNNLTRMKGHAIWVGQNISSNAEETPQVNTIITGNTMTDVIDRQYFVDGNASSISLRCYMRIDGKAPRAGGLAVPPGALNTATARIQSPYDYFYSTSGTGNTLPTRGVSGIILSGNIARRTLPSGSAYSAWGHGQAFTKTGFRDTVVSEAMMRGMGLDVRVPSLEDVSISDNTLAPGSRGILFTLNSQTDRMVSRMRIRGNTIEDCDEACIWWPGTALSHQDLVIEDNVLDADPYFLSANRGTSGTWLAAAGPYAIRVPNIGGAHMTKNRVRNCAIAIDQTGASAFQTLSDNLIYADAAATNFSTSNKGVGTIPGIGGGEHWWLQYEDSDPTSATYKQSLGANIRTTSGQPTTGKWLAGQIVYNRPTAPLGAGGSQYLLVGFLRKTTGSAHVANTDWNEMRCLTGT
jgi:Right handed beta helix region